MRRSRNDRNAPQCGARVARERVARRAVVWSLSENNQLAREIAAARAEHARAIVAALRERHRLPAFIDLNAIVALLSAAMTHLALHAQPGASVGALEPRRDNEWHRLERALTNIVSALLGPSDQ